METESNESSLLTTVEAPEPSEDPENSVTSGASVTSGNFPKYHSIENLVRMKMIYDVECVVTEKIHGTNCRIGKIVTNGTSELFLGSRNGIIYDSVKHHEHYDSYDFYEFVEASWGVKNLEHILPDDTVYIGEFYGAGIQKEILYFSNQIAVRKRDIADEQKSLLHRQRGFCVFDIIHQGKYLSHTEKLEHLKLLLLNDKPIFYMPPILHEGKINTDLLNRFISEPSVLATNNGKLDSCKEGIVITPLIEVTTRTGRRLIAKYKNPAFDETTPVMRENPKSTSSHFELGVSKCTYARVVNCIDKLRQTGTNNVTKASIPNLIEIVYQDIITDCSKEELPLSEDQQSWKELRRGAASNVARYLLEWLNKSV